MSGPDFPLFRIVHRTSDTEVVSYDYGDLLLSWELRSFAWDHPAHQDLRGSRNPGTDFYTAYYGTEGTLILDGSGWKVFRADGEPGPVVKNTGGSHEKNFLDCVKSRQRPHSDIEIGRLSTTLCHLGNISYKLGRDVHFDPATETFPGDREAARLLTKEYRAPYGLPKV